MPRQMLQLELSDEEYRKLQHFAEQHNVCREDGTGNAEEMAAVIIHRSLQGTRTRIEDDLTFK